MSDQLLMPKLGLTMTEGLLLEWKVAPGAAFAKGEVLFVVETDKAATEIEAETAGVLAEQLVAEGDTVAVGSVVGRIGNEGAAGASKAAPSPATTEKTQPDAQTKPAPTTGERKSAPDRLDAARIVATPLARRLAREKNIDLAGVKGSGPRGRIKAADLDSAEAAAPAKSAAQPAAGSVRRSKPTAMQSAMARRLSAVKQGVPHFYLSSEVEVSALADLRASLNADGERPKLTLNHFILAAVGRALAAHPNINRVWADGDILEFEASDVSMAVETEGGLYVPVVRNAGTLSLDQVAAQARAAAQKARDARLSAADMDGAAIAVSNAGMHDVTWLTSIINPGQSAILGVGSVRELFRPDAEGRPALRREMGLVFSGDHRVHTGVEGLTFLNRVKSYLEHPMRLLRHG